MPNWWDNYSDTSAPTPAPEAAPWWHTYAAASPIIPKASPSTEDILTGKTDMSGNAAPQSDEFGPRDRGVIGNFTHGLSEGLNAAAEPGYPAQPVGTSGGAGELLGSLAGGVMNPINIPQNIAAGEVGTLATKAAAPAIEGIGRLFGGKAASVATHAVSGAAGSAPFGTAEAAGHTSLEDVINNPVGVAADIGKSTATAGLLGAGVAAGLHGATAGVKALSGAKATLHPSTAGLPPIENTLSTFQDQMAGAEHPDLVKAPTPETTPDQMQATNAEMKRQADEATTESPVKRYTPEEAAAASGNKQGGTELLTEMAKKDGQFVEATITPDMLDQSPQEIAGEDGVSSDTIKSNIENPPEGEMPPILAVSSPDVEGKLTLADGRHRVLGEVAKGRLAGSQEPAQIKALVPEAWARERGLIPETPSWMTGENRPGVTHPAGITPEHQIENAMGASSLLGNPSVAGASFMGGTLAKAKAGWATLGQKIGAGKDFLGNIAGEALPTMARLNRESAEAGVHVRSSREYALARGTEAHEAMIRAAGGTRTEGKAVADKAWAALTEDNLRGLRDQLTAANDPQGAKAVRSMIGTAAPGLKTEAEYQATLSDPKVKAAIAAYEKFRPELEEKFQAGANNPNANLNTPITRGKQTGVRINLLAKVDSQGNMVNQNGTPGSGTAGGLRNPLNRKPKTARAATGTAGAYNVNAKEGVQHSFLSVTEPAAKREFTAALEKAGLAEIHRGYGDPVEGRKAVEIEPAKPARDKNGNAVVDKSGAPVMVQPLVMYPDPRILPEIRRVYNLDDSYSTSIITKLLNTHTGASLVGFGEAVYHTGTLVGGVQRAFNMKGGPASNLLNSGLIRLGRSLYSVGEEAMNAYKHTPESLAMKSERARVGATRPDSGSKWPGAVYIHGLHEAAAATIQRMVREAQQLGRIPKTETALRDAITKNLGQYNKGLKGKITAAMQESGAVPFLGTQKAQLGLLGRFYTGSTGVKGAAPSLRLNHFANLVGTAMQIGAASYLLSGHFFGREGVPLGDIDTGKDDKDGNPITIPTTFMFGLTPFKRSGGQKITTGLKDGRDKGLIAQDTYQEIVRNVTRLAGPGVKTVFTLATGKAFDPALFDVTPAPDDDAIPFVENAKTAAAQINSGATKAAARGVAALGFPETAGEMNRYAGHPEDSIARSQLRAILPAGAPVPNDDARLAAKRRDAQKRRAREARKSNAE